MNNDYYKNIGKAAYWAKDFESLLEDIYGAEGRGLHEKINCIEKEIDFDILKKLRYVATIRNKLVHEKDYNELDDGFEGTCKEIEHYLLKEKKRIQNKGHKKVSLYKVIGGIFQFIKKINK